MKLTDKLKIGVLASSLVVASGCASTNGRDDALLGLVLMGTGIKENNPVAASVGRGLVDYGSAKAGRSEVNVNVGNTQYRTNRVDNRELVIQYYKDDNGNGKIDEGENLGNVEGPINLDNYGLEVWLQNPGSESVTYSVRDKNGNKIGSTTTTRLEANNSYIINSKKNSGDFMDNLNGFSKKNPGEYTIYAKQYNSSKVFKKKVTITRNKVD